MSGKNIFPSKICLNLFCIFLVWVIVLIPNLSFSKTILASPIPCLDQFYPVYKDVTKHRPVSGVSDIKLVINKRERKLFVLRNGKPWKVYSVALSQIPYGDKRKEGDKRTPEGEFYVCKKDPNSKYYLSLELSYPSLKHAEKGLKAGLISKKEYLAIIHSLEEGKIPPQNTNLGGHICIHGGGNGTNWTEGCIALKNKDISELYKIVQIGTPVVIFPR